MDEPGNIEKAARTLGVRPGDLLGGVDLPTAARLLGIVSEGPKGGGLGHLLADLPETHVTPEIRVECPEERKFALVAAAVDHFGRLHEVNTIDGIRISHPKGWGLLRASNTQPVLVLRFEATDPASLETYRAEMMDWLREQGLEV